MKKLAISILAILLFGSYIELSAQNKIFSKHEDLKDFYKKTLMVVLENNSYTDMALKDAVEKRWEICKYEFITPDKFETLKGDSSYYFLTRVKGKFKKEQEPGIEFLSLYIGGPKGVDEISKMYEIASIPFQPLDSDVDNSSFLRSYVKSLEDFVLRVQRKKIASRMGLQWFSNDLQSIGKDAVILINTNDMVYGLNHDGILSMFNNKGKLVDEDQINEALDNNSKSTYVTLTIAPEEPVKGSYCYKILVGTENDEIVYFRRQKITPKNRKGFNYDDLNKISIPFNQ